MVQTGMAQPSASGGNTLADAEYRNALEKLDLETRNDPNRIIHSGYHAIGGKGPDDRQFWTSGQAPDYYVTADGRTIARPAPATEADRHLTQRMSVIDNVKDLPPGSVFEQDGKQYQVFRHGADATGQPTYRALSVDGSAMNKPSPTDIMEGNVMDGRRATALLNKYDEAQKRLSGLSPEDTQTVAAHHDREQRRRVIDAQYQYALAGGGSAPATATASAAAPVKVKGRDTIGPKAADYVPFNFVNDPVERQNLQIFSHATAGAEGGDYTKIVGGGNFDNFSAHPQKVGMVTKDGKSRAAGRYMIGGDTWNDAAAQRGYKDFSPQNQDDAFMYLLAKHDALRNVLKGDYDGAIQKLGTEWQALPTGASKNQGKRSMKEWQDLLSEARYKYAFGNPAAAAQAPATPAAPPTGAAPTTIAGAAAAPDAAAAMPPMAPTVDVVGMNGNTVTNAFGNDGSRTQLEPQSIYMVQQNRSAMARALARDPALAQRVTYTPYGEPLIDGVALPPQVLAGGTDRINTHLDNLNQASLYGANPMGARITEEAAKERARRTPVPGEVIYNPESMGQPDAMGVQKVEKVPYVRQDDKTLKRAVPEPQEFPEPHPDAIKELRANKGNKLYMDSFIKNFGKAQYLKYKDGK
jgi:muramidase (phage lysozyme)